MNYFKFSRLLQVADTLDKKGFFSSANIIDQLFVFAVSDRKKLELLFGPGKLYFKKSPKGWREWPASKLTEYITTTPALFSIWNSSNYIHDKSPVSDPALGSQLETTMILPPHEIRIIDPSEKESLLSENENIKGEMQEEKLKSTPEGAWAVGALQMFAQLVEVPVGYVRKGVEIDSGDYVRCRNCKQVSHKEDRVPTGNLGEFACPHCGKEAVTVTMEGKKEDIPTLYPAPFRPGARIRIRNFPNAGDLVQVLEELFGATTKEVGNVIMLDSFGALLALKRLGFKVGVAESDKYTAEDVWISNADNPAIAAHFKDSQFEKDYTAGKNGEPSPASVTNTVDTWPTGDREPGTLTKAQRDMLIKLADLLDEKNLLEEANVIDRVIKF